MHSMHLLGLRSNMQKSNYPNYVSNHYLYKLVPEQAEIDRHFPQYTNADNQHKKSYLLEWSS